MKEVIVLIPFCLSQKVCNDFKKRREFYIYKTRLLESDAKSTKLNLAVYATGVGCSVSWPETNCDWGAVNMYTHVKIVILHPFLS